MFILIAGVGVFDLPAKTLYGIPRSSDDVIRPRSGVGKPPIIMGCMRRLQTYFRQTILLERILSSVFRKIWTFNTFIFNWKLSLNSGEFIDQGDRDFGECKSYFDLILVLKWMHGTFVLTEYLHNGWLHSSQSLYMWTFLCQKIIQPVPI